MDKQTKKYRPVFHFPEVHATQWRWVARPKYEIYFDQETMEYATRFVEYGNYQLEQTPLMPHSDLTECLDYLLNKQMYNYNMKGHSPK